jgi:uncharacterized membrane protein YfcA
MTPSRLQESSALRSRSVGRLRRTPSPLPNQNVSLAQCFVNQPHDPPIWTGIIWGATIGLLSGLTGTGGGIFLSPVSLFVGWSETRMASGVAAVFILCNSVAGLLGNVAIVKALPTDLPIYAGAVLLGAIAGTTFGILKASA